MAINLVKGQRISLEKTAGKALSSVKMGLGWDAATEGDDVDLDGSCVMLDAEKKILDIIYFGELKSKDGSVIHSGDNLTGEGDGDDEVINVQLNAVPAAAQYLVFAVTSYSGHSFSRISNAFCRVIDENDTEVCRFALSDMQNQTGMVIANLYRHNSEWKFRAIGEFANGRTIMDIAGLIQRMV